MDGATTDCAAFDETVVFLKYFNDLPDPRQQGKVAYPRDATLLLCLHLGMLFLVRHAKIAGVGMFARENSLA